MVAMMSGPPQRTLLHRAAAKPSQAKLEKPAGFVGAVGKVTVEAPGYAKHANDISQDAKTQGGVGRGDEQNGQARNVQKHKRAIFHPVGQSPPRSQQSPAEEFRFQITFRNVLRNGWTLTTAWANHHQFGVEVFSGTPGPGARTQELFLLACLEALRIELWRLSSARRRASQGFS